MTLWSVLRDRVVAVGSGRSRRLLVSGLLAFLIGGAVIVNFALFGVLQSHLSKQPPLASPAVSPHPAGGSSAAESAPGQGGAGTPAGMPNDRRPASRSFAPGGGSAPTNEPSPGAFTGNQPVVGNPQPGTGPAPGNGPPPGNSTTPGSEPPTSNGPPTPGLPEFPLPVLAVIPLLAVMGLTLTWHRARPTHRRRRGLHAVVAPMGRVPTSRP